jgi:hypothetical protein
MYESTLGTSGIQQLGWATLRCRFTQEEGVGDAPDSFAFDGKRRQLWNVKSFAYGQVNLAPGRLCFIHSHCTISCRGAADCSSVCVCGLVVHGASGLSWVGRDIRMPILFCKLLESLNLSITPRCGLAQLFIRVSGVRVYGTSLVFLGLQAFFSRYVAYQT